MQYLGILATVFGTNYAFWDIRNAFLGRIMPFGTDVTLFWDEITIFAA